MSFRNTYDSDNVVFSPQGRLHQVEYALEAVKQGSATVGLRSKTHVVLVALKRSKEDLASYQKKLIRIDDHICIGISGLTSDARVLSNVMRQSALSHRMVNAAPIPVKRVINEIADKAQWNTQIYGRRPYGVGFLVAGSDATGPHLIEFAPTGTTFEYYAMAIGSRSQSAKTYLERNFDSFADCTPDELVRHGLIALKETLQKDQELTIANTSVAIVGPPVNVNSIQRQTFESALVSERGEIKETTRMTLPEPARNLTLIEGDDLTKYLNDLPAESTEPDEPRTAPTTQQQTQSADAPSTGGGEGGDSMETD